MSDILRISIYPIVVSIIITIISFTLGASLSAYSSSSKTKIDTTTLWIVYIGFLLLLLVSYFSGLHYWRIIFGLLLIDLIDRSLSRLNLIKNFFPNQNVPHTIFCIIIGLPILAFSAGNMNSHEFLDGNNVQHVKVSIFKNKELFDKQEYLKYIGLKGNYLFLLSLDNTKLYITNFSKVPILELVKSIHEDKGKKNLSKTKELTTK